MTLTDISFRIASSPALMVSLLSSGNAHKSATVKSMFSAKLANAKNGIFRAIRRNDNESFHLWYVGIHRPFMKFRREFFTTVVGRFADVSSTDLEIGFVATRWTLKGRYSHLFNGFSGVSFACMRLFHLALGFFARLSRASNRSKVVALLTKRFEFIKPVLFTSGQEYGQNQFQHFKAKSGFTVLIESMLKFCVAVGIATKVTEMGHVSYLQVNGTSKVELLGNRTCNAVNTRGVGNRRGLNRMVQWEHSDVNLRYRFASLGLGRATNTLLDRTISSHYTTKSAPCLALRHMASGDGR